MSQRKNTLICVFCAIAMAVLILDAQHAVAAAKNGVIICLYTIIPALFPFCVLSIIYRSMLTGKQTRLLSKFERFTGMPSGTVILFFLGALGGYPVGAICIEQARKNKEISDEDARRMTCFCNNAGPAFIFGMMINLFDSYRFPLIIWVIQLVSSVLTGAILPCKSSGQVHLSGGKAISFKSALDQSARSMLNVCSLVILFRIIIEIAERWILWIVPVNIRVIIAGFTELTNGIISLANISNDGLRFIYACGFLSFGGICVVIQTLSISGSTSFAAYFLSKLLQTSVCMSLSCLYVILSNPDSWKSMIWVIFVTVPVIFVTKRIYKKTVAFPKQILYNTIST